MSTMWYDRCDEILKSTGKYPEGFPEELSTMYMCKCLQKNRIYIMETLAKQDRDKMIDTYSITAKFDKIDWCLGITPEILERDMNTRLSQPFKFKVNCTEYKECDTREKECKSGTVLNGTLEW